MAAPTYQAVGTVQGSASGISVSWPTHASGDIGLLFVETKAQDPGGTWPPSGWTLLSTSTHSTDTRLYVLWRRATSSSMGAAAVADSGTRQVGVILTIRGAAASGEPVLRYATGNGAISAGASQDLASVSVVSGNQLLVAALSRGNYASATNFSDWGGYYPLGTATERYDGGVSVGGLAGEGGGIGIATSTLSGSGGATPMVSSSGAIASAWSVFVLTSVSSAELATSSSVALTSSATLTSAASIQLECAPVASLSGSAGLTTVITCVASGSCALITGGTLSTHIALAGGAPISLSTSAEVTTAISFMATSPVSLTGEGELTGTAAIQFTADVSPLTLTGEGTLTTGIHLSAVAAITLATSAGATTQIPLAGEASLTLAAGGALSTGVSLRATAPLSWASVGALTTEIHLVAAGGLFVYASGTFIDVPWGAEVFLTLQSWGALSTPRHVPASIARFIQVPAHPETVS